VHFSMPHRQMPTVRPSGLNWIAAGDPHPLVHDGEIWSVEVGIDAAEIDVLAADDSRLRYRKARVDFSEKGAHEVAHQQPRVACLLINPC
jgi:hypothetical protein